MISYYVIPLNQVFMYHCNFFKINLEREYFLVYTIKICIVCKGEHDNALLKQSFWFLLPVKRAFRDLPTVPSLFKRVCGKQSIYVQFSFPSMNFAYVCRRVKYNTSILQKWINWNIKSDIYIFNSQPFRICFEIQISLWWNFPPVLHTIFL